MKHTISKIQLWLSKMVMKLVNRAIEVFEPEEVEVTFTKEYHHTTYTYNKVHH